MTDLKKKTNYYEFTFSLFTHNTITYRKEMHIYIHLQTIWNIVKSTYIKVYLLKRNAVVMWKPPHVETAVVVTLGDSGQTTSINRTVYRQRLFAKYRDRSLSSSSSWIIPVTRAVCETRESFGAAQRECAAESCRLLFLSAASIFSDFRTDSHFWPEEGRLCSDGWIVRWLRARPPRADNTELREHTQLKSVW